MPITYNQKHSNNGTIDSATGLSVSFGSNHNAGNNVFVALLSFDSTTDTPVLSDNDGTTVWNIIGPLRLTGTLAGQSLMIAWTRSTFAGTGRTVTLKSTSGSYNGAIAVINAEGFTNPATSEGSPTLNQVSGSPVSTNTITTTTLNGMLFAVCYPEGTTTALTTAGWTDLVAGGDGSWRGGDYGYEIVSAAQTAVSAAFTDTGGANALGILALVDSSGAPATQIVAPASDVSVGGWLAEPGDGATNLYQQIDETVLSATDYIQSSQSPIAADIYKLRIAPLMAPVKPRTDSSFHFRVDYMKDIVGGDNMQLTVKLYAADGTTLIKTWTPITVTTETTSDLTLTGAEADTIPDADFATGLVLAFEALKI